MAHLGNTIVEYTLIGIAVIVVSIGALNLLGQSIHGAFAAVKGSMENSIQSSNSAIAQHASAKANFVAGVSSQITINANTPSVLSGSLASLVQTSGANGATAALSLQLQTLANQLLSEGKISQDEANKLLALANQGFIIASLESQIEAASKSAASNQDFLNTTINFQGTSYLVKDAANLIGFSSPGNPTTDLSANSNYMLQTNTASPQTLAFLNLYQQAINSPELTTAGAVASVQQLSAQISYLSDVTCDLANSAYNPQITLTALHQQTISSATAYDSSQIAQMGQ